MEKRKLIISTDIGTDIDDALAVYIAATHPKIDLKAVWVTNGNVDIRAKIAWKLLNYLGKPTEVWCGESSSLSGIEPYMHGYEKKFLTPREQFRSQKWPIKRNGLECLARLLEQEQDLYLASIAPMTNLAKMLEVPGLSKIKHVYAMACRFGGIEHNIRFDTIAAEMVLNSNLPITIVPSEVCSRFMMPVSDLLYEPCQGKSLAFIAEMAAAWKLHNDRAMYLDLKIPEDFVPTGNSKEKLAALVLIQTLKESSHIRSLEDAENYAFRIRMVASMYPKLSNLLESIRSAEKKNFAVHDVYTIFAMVHPDSVSSQRANVAVDSLGQSEMLNGNKHTIITDVDYAGFKRFLYKGLGISTQLPQGEE